MMRIVQKMLKRMLFVYVPVSVGELRLLVKKNLLTLFTRNYG